MKALFTDQTTSNLGVPKNPAMSYYLQTKPDRYGYAADPKIQALFVWLADRGCLRTNEKLLGKYAGSCNFLIAGLLFREYQSYGAAIFTRLPSTLDCSSVRYSSSSGSKQSSFFGACACSKPKRKVICCSCDDTNNVV